MGRRRTFGNVRKLPSRRHQARYRDLSGRRHRASRNFATVAGANRRLAAAEAEITRCAWVEPAGGRHLIGPPKSEAGRQTLVMPDALVPGLAIQLAGLVRPEHVARVVSGAKGAPIRRHNWWEKWGRRDRCEHARVDAPHGSRRSAPPSATSTPSATATNSSRRRSTESSRKERHEAANAPR